VFKKHPVSSSLKLKSNDEEMLQRSNQIETCKKRLEATKLEHLKLMKKGEKVQDPRYLSNLYQEERDLSTEINESTKRIKKLKSDQAQKEIKLAKLTAQV